LVITKADIDYMLSVNKEDPSLGSVDAGKQSSTFGSTSATPTPRARAAARRTPS